MKGVADKSNSSFEPSPLDGVSATPIKQSRGGHSKMKKWAEVLFFLEQLDKAEATQN